MFGKLSYFGVEFLTWVFQELHLAGAKKNLRKCSHVSSVSGASWPDFLWHQGPVALFSRALGHTLEWTRILREDEVLGVDMVATDFQALKI